MLITLSPCASPLPLAVPCLPPLSSQRIHRHRVKAVQYRAAGNSAKAAKHEAQIAGLTPQFTCVWRVLLEIAAVSTSSLRLRAFYPKAQLTIASTLTPTPAPTPTPSHGLSSASLPPLIVPPRSPRSTNSSSPSSSHLAPPSLAIPLHHRRLSLNSASFPSSPLPEADPLSPDTSGLGLDDAVPPQVASAVRALRLLPSPPLPPPHIFPLPALASFRALHALAMPPASSSPWVLGSIPQPEKLSHRRVSAQEMGGEVKGVDVEDLEQDWEDDGLRGAGPSMMRVVEVGGGQEEGKEGGGGGGGLPIPGMGRARSSSTGSKRLWKTRGKDWGSHDFQSHDDEEEEEGEDDGDEMDAELDGSTSDGGTTDGESSDFDDAVEALGRSHELSDVKHKEPHLSLLQRLTLSGVFRSS